MSVCVCVCRCLDRMVSSFVILRSMAGFDRMKPVVYWTVTFSTLGKSQHWMKGINVYLCTTCYALRLSEPRSCVAPTSESNSNAFTTESNVRVQARRAAAPSPRTGKRRFS
jgi:hypothetical protein